MELNEIHTEHEHATTSLKVVLLVFAIVLVGALSYLVWASNSAPDTTDNSAATTKKTTTNTPSTSTATPSDTKTDETASWKTYKSAEFDFNFKYPDGKVSIYPKDSFKNSGSPSQPSYYYLFGTLCYNPAKASGSDCLLLITGSSWSTQENLAKQKEYAEAAAKTDSSVDTKEKTVVLGGQNATYLYGFYFLTYKGTSYVIDAPGLSPSNNPDLSVEIKKVLDTLKFE